MSNTPKQLTQEQIDSLNAVYAKMNDDRLVLEYRIVSKHYNSEWDVVSTDLSNEERLPLVFDGRYQYRIKEKKKVKKFKVEEKLLPFVKKYTYPVNRAQAGHFELNIRLESESYEDLLECCQFVFNIPSIEVEE